MKKIVKALWQFCSYVFVGDMSLVGPRPEVRHYVDYWTPEQMHVLDVKPGITDPASIKFRNENELMEKAEDPEKYYIEVIMQEKIKLYLEYVISNFVEIVKGL